MKMNLTTRILAIARARWTLRPNQHRMFGQINPRSLSVLISIASYCRRTLLVTFALLVGTSAATAATNIPWDFSSIIPKSTWIFDDCSVEVGVVYDSVPFPNYRKIGGVRLNCRSLHRWLDASVAMQYYYNGAWHQYGDSAYGVRYNAYGSGAGLSGILRTTPICAGTASRGLWWRVVANVRTDRQPAGAVVASNAAADHFGC